jgi:hypothetical protein
MRQKVPAEEDDIRRIVGYFGEQFFVPVGMAMQVGYKKTTDHLFLALSNFAEFSRAPIIEA